ncbi:hypothetical protein JNB71_01185 [Rhizobium herbae]|uniref:Uncharacterized protein n=2 Tax=Rhizobium herbae TaxID=508661 RepID=A0ABS7H5V6_9HYPH|nr:hypothetical protein [Rhizobium herbae]
MTLVLVAAVTEFSSLPITACVAGDVHVAPVTAYVEANVRAWIEDPVVIEALKDHNERHAHLSQADINRMDAEWRSQRSSERRPLIDSVAATALSKFLKAKQAASGGAITEIFVIDAKGLSIGVSEPGSDYWQGDEPKWQKTYLAGTGTLFVDRAEKDESTQTLQSQASFTVADPQTHKPIGTLTVGINLDAL